jgi:amino acid adenylation domain-containing protein
VEAALGVGAGADAPPLTRAARGGESPLSHAQQRLWFIDQLEPGNPFYNTPQVLRLSGALSLPALEYTLNEIVRRHEILRTKFVPAGDQVVQVICPPGPVPLPVIDLTAEEGREAKEAAAREIVDAEIRRPFDLGDGALLRVRLLKLDEEEHIIIFATHHIVSDGWSLGVLIREVAALYRAHLAGESSPLPELEIQYADFAVWQRGWLQGEALERQLAYWRERLGGAPAALALPTDRPRPAVRTYRGGRLSFDLPAGLSRELRAFSRREGATLFMTMLAVWQLLLARYSGQEDISVGTPIANRNRVETEPLIGFFVNTLVMRTTVSPGQSFAQLLRQVREVCLGAYAHQDVPFERVVEELQPERGLSMSPLFQVMFGLQNAPAETLELPGLKLAPVDGEVGMTKFDLILSASDAGETVNCLLEFDADLFDAATAERIASSYRTLLESAASEPERDVATLPILSHDERRRLLVEWCGRDTSYPANSTIQALFEEQAERTPDATAVVWDSGCVTYGELNRRANGLAHYLRSQGVGPDVLVGISANRSAEVVTGLLGILKAGGAYVPLDADYPAQRLRYMIDDAGVKLLLAGRGSHDIQGVQGLRVVSLDEATTAGARVSQANPPRVACADNLAYVIYTSGSTGRPKGIGVNHRAVLRLVCNAGYIELTGADAVAQASTVSFDASTFEVWGALLSGARLVVIPKELALDAAGFSAELQRRGVTVLFLTTALFNQVAREAADAFAGLRQLMFGGEACDPRLVRRVLEGGGAPGRLLHVYGPSESTTFATWYEVAGVPEGAATVPIGKPLSNTQTYVLDGRLGLAPVGAAGELYIGGAGLARGYLGRPGLTAERFVPNPFSAEPGARMYRTGDLVRHSAGGEIEFLGRVDQQVKVRGFRIEPGEVEAALSEHALVRECVVVVGEDGARGRRLVAYVAAGGGREPVAGGVLREYLRGRLPEYMVPSAFVIIDRLPLTANGKVDRRALPEPGSADGAGEGGAESVPRTPLEELLAGIFARVLGMERVSVEESFFDLGGHSLLATQLVSRVREACAVELPLRALFEQPSVAQLAAEVERLLRGGGGAQGQSPPPLERADRAGALPLSFAQRRLWFFDQLKPGDTFYNMPAALRLTGRLNVRALEDALTEIVRRHESLRTAFRMNAGEAAQVILEEVRVDLPTVELSGLADEEREAIVRQLAESDARRPFDLASGALVRFRLLKLGELGHVLLVSMHHIISDAWSLGVFVREASELYDAYSAGLVSPLPELLVQYPDYAVWQRGWLRGEVLKAQLDYWKGRLAGAPELLTLPESKPRPPVQSTRGGQQALTLSPELADSLKALKDREGVTLFMLMLAAFQLLLSWRTGQTDIVVGSPVAGRNHPETEPLMGFFVNTLVMRTDMRGDPTFRELLRRVRETALGAYAHQDAPFEMLVDELAPQRSLSHTPLFQVALGVQNAPPPPPHLSGLVVEGLGVPVEVARFDLELLMIDTGAGIDAALTYSLDLFEAGDARRLLTLFESLLGSVAADPEATLQTLFASLAEADARQRAAAEAEFKEAGRRSLKGVRRRPLSPTRA